MKPERQENRKRDGSNNNKTNVFGNLDTVLATVCINFYSKRESLTYNKKIFIVVTHKYPTEGQISSSVKKNSVQVFLQYYWGHTELYPIEN